ncbi:YybH family protein [Brachybacterium sp. GCM10030268]|uniref:YybH family protein n=1 Tax=Brachybacterium sp. GCM10030268 TaxID=3273382 RepID=UPI0036173546
MRENNMSDNELEKTIRDWIGATNTHTAANYLAFFTEDAVLDDPSVGEVFEGRARIEDYFRSYFVGYNTQTQLVSVESREGYVHVEVKFTGDFPEGEVGGIFDITVVADYKFQHIKADLIR